MNHPVGIDVSLEASSVCTRLFSMEGDELSAVRPGQKLSPH